MENAVVKETTDILKRLTPKNQSYFMTLVWLAEVAENAVRHQEAEHLSTPCDGGGQSTGQTYKRTV